MMMAASSTREATNPIDAASPWGRITGKSATAVPMHAMASDVSNQAAPSGPDVAPAPSTNLAPSSAGRLSTTAGIDVTKVTR